VPLKSMSVDAGGTDLLDRCVGGRARHAPRLDSAVGAGATAQDDGDQVRMG
jgi:hypothetical protein